MNNKISMYVENILLEYFNNSNNYFNPLVICGNEDNIKKYLNNVKEYITTNSKKSLLYITSENFISDIDKINFDEIDIIVLENIEKLENNITAQFKLFDVFNTLYDKEKLIIISMAKTPDELQNFEERLITRLNWGTIVKI